MQHQGSSVLAWEQMPACGTGTLHAICAGLWYESILRAVGSCRAAQGSPLNQGLRRAWWQKRARRLTGIQLSRRMF